MTFEPSDAVAVGPVAGKGLGVFARRAIRKGELIERVPLLILSAEEYARGVDQSLLAGYVFAWGDNQYALALGYGSIYNHSYRPNAVYEDDDAPHPAKRFVAHRAIRAGEEITVNYNGDPASRVRMWFEVTPDAKPPRPRRKTVPDESPGPSARSNPLWPDSQQDTPQVGQWRTDGPGPRFIVKSEGMGEVRR